MYRSERRRPLARTIEWCDDGRMRSGGGDARPISSRLLLELRRERQEAEERLTPARRLEAAYTLSRNLQRLFRAGLRAQGFSDTEIEALWVRRR